MINMFITCVLTFVKEIKVDALYRKRKKKRLYVYVSLNCRKKNQKRNFQITQFPTFQILILCKKERFSDLVLSLQ